MFAHFLLSWFMSIALRKLLEVGEIYLQEYTSDKAQWIKDELYKVVPYHQVDAWLETQIEAAIPFIFEEARRLLGVSPSDAVFHGAIANVQAKVSSHPAFSAARSSEPAEASNYTHQEHRL